ncbi:tetratricopeptide repeat protein [Sphingomonas sp. BT-65]|uniref:tetratricopeptide repeat protein n=1 Tax=Sphingomonas sp. BT-65 TaxID=2989821 RepID=UPI00223694E8|nr:tetratricopeptide repeat protein [Sphingomonas sp. BT-65]MCW4463809.1 tetratricopeptide repeat protein [Sphingomonas sp. BT-65]
MQSTDGLPTSRFDRLTEFLEQDPHNQTLATDAVEAAISENRPDEAEALLARHRLDAVRTAYLSGLIAMHRRRWSHAAAQFRGLFAAGETAPAIRFNLAWSLAMEKQPADALSVLDNVTAQTLPQAAELEVRLRHELDDFEGAEARARALLEVHPDHRGLNAAVATLAIDIEDVALAAHCAQRAGDHPEALATLGTLALEAEDSMQARKLFEQALERDPNSPRALIGRGLSRLIEADHAGAAAELDRGAELFGTHLGSWIAAGWAHFTAGDMKTARSRFEHALALDDSFAESHGSLAVLDLLEGKLDQASRRVAIAKRLDRASFSAALAEMLLAAGSGDAEKSRRIFEAALATPFDASGRTLAQSFARLGARAG